MKVIIRMKSGFEMAITCDDFKCRTVSDPFSLDKIYLTGYEYTNAKDCVPLFVPFDQVECIYRVLEESETIK